MQQPLKPAGIECQVQRSQCTLVVALWIVFCLISAGAPQVIASDAEAAPEIGMTAPDGVVEQSPFATGYSEGFYISPHDPEQIPFELRINNQDQLRYAGFARDVRTRTDSVGVVRPVVNRSAFELTRGRLIFSGFAFSPQLTYHLTIDYTTVSDNQINFWNYWLSYKFNRGLSLSIGQTQVPGSREWMTPSIYLLGPDYSLATTFFRPSLSQGIWATGEPVDGLFYRVMLSNGFNTLGTSSSGLDSRMAFSGTVWVEPLGDFGRGFKSFFDAREAIRRDLASSPGTTYRSPAAIFSMSLAKALRTDSIV